MSRRLAPFLIAAFVAAAAPAARGQSLEEQLAFGQGLIQRGYGDLAEEFYTRQRDAAAKDNEKVAYALGILQVKSDGIDRAPSDKRTAAVDTAIKEFEAFLAKYAAHPEAQQARFDIGELLSRKGRILADLGKRENKRELFGEAEKVFQQAETYLKEIGDTLGRELQALEAKPQTTPAEQERIKFLQEKRMLARYYHIIALFEHGDTQEQRETGAGKGVFQGVEKASKDFLWDYEGFIVAFDVAIYLGRAYAAMDDFEHAIPYLEQAWGLAHGDAQAARQYSEIPKRAYFYKAQAFNGRGDRTKDKKNYDDALKALDTAFKTFPDLRGEDLGKACELEQATAYLGLGQRDKAIDIYSRFIKEGGRWQYVAQERLNKLGGGASAAVPIDLRIQAADGLTAQQKYREAVKQYRQIVSDCRTPEDRRKHVPTCCFKIGMCYLYEERYEEALIAFAALDKFPEHPRAEEAAFEQIRARSLLRKYADEMGGGHAKEAETAFQQSLDQFIRKFPKSPKAQDIFYVRGGAKEKEGDFQEAAKLYAQVPKAAQSYEKALASIGYCIYRNADALWEGIRKERTRIMQQVSDQRKRAKQPELPDAELEKLAEQQLEAKRAEPRRLFTEAEAKLKEYIQFASTQPKPDDAKAADARKTALLAARYYLSRLYLHEAVRKPSGVLEALKGVEKDYREPRFAQQVALILESRLKAAIELKKLDDNTPESARQTFELLRQQYAVHGAKSITRTAEDLAWAYDARGMALDEEVKKAEEAAAAKRKAVEDAKKAEKPDAAKLKAAEKAAADAEAALAPLRQKRFESHREAGTFFHLWISRRIDDGERIRPANFDGVGGKLFELAQISPPGRAREDLYRQALEMFTGLWTSIERHLQGREAAPEGIKPADFWKIQWRMARCHAALGRPDDLEKAAVLYDALMKREDLKDQGFLYEEKAALHLRAGDALWGVERRKAVEHFESAQRIYAQLISKIDPLAEPPPPKEALRVYWQSNLAYIQCYVKLNDLERAQARIAQMRNLYPDMDRDEFGFKSGLEAVEKEIAPKLPKTRK